MAAALKAKFDLTIIGGGIIGLATARQVLLRHPKLRVCVIEKEKELASHQSKRNSGVVHCGIYYKKGSLKSKFCIKGSKSVKHYCHERNLPYKQCGKLIVATKQDELERLHNLHANATSNNLEGVELISGNQVEQYQPGCTKAIEAIWCPNTAIVDWQLVARSYANDFQQAGGSIFTNFTARFFAPERKERISILDANSERTIDTKSVVNCAGLFSDYFARQTGNNEHPKVIPFKGIYFLLSDRLAKTIKTNIYPVPNEKLPFLGIHMTPRLDGSVLVGPTAILALNYERYSEQDPIKFSHMYNILLRSGLWKLIAKKDNIVAGLTELRRILSRKSLVSELSEFLPDIKDEDILDTEFCGIRAQNVTEDGKLVDDFLFETGYLPQFSKILHVRNAPSPAATSSLAIADRIADTLEERFI